MKSNKRLIRKEAYRRYSGATGGVMGPPTEQEMLAGAKVKGKGWTLLSDVLGTATAFFSAHQPLITRRGLADATKHHHP